jgi:hypothetical protein
VIKKLGVVSVFKKAPFPASMTVISFALFMLVYWFLTQTTVKPFYLQGLLFAIPFICFAIISIFTSLGTLNIFNSTIITIIVMITCSVALGSILFYLAVEAATTGTTDINQYEKVLKLTHYPKDPLIRYFPEQIPENAEEVQFCYNPAFLQGGENFALKFKTDPDSINQYIYSISAKAKWIGESNASDAEKYGIFERTLYIFDWGDERPPSDLVIYVTYSRPYQPDDWNHGERSLIAISKERNEVLFLADQW